MDMRPPWNYSFMLSGVWLALLPTAGIVVGLMTALTEPAKSLRSGLFFTALWVAVYLAAIFLIYLSLPIYSTGKASYMLGLSPCFGVLAAADLERITRRPLTRVVVYAWLACWAVCAYLAYFVVSPFAPL